MSLFIIVIIGLLLVLGAFHLVVGVSNDAVNFLNSAIGSRVAPYWLIMTVASLGVLLGATFSNGMMGIAQNGILMPQYFSFYELLFIFLGAIISNILILDGFNTYGFPTSTTVTFVFALLGGTLASSLFGSNTNGLASKHLLEHFNTSESRMIVSELFWSVPTTFVLAAVVQYITRFIFGFNYHERFKILGPIWCSISFSFILYQLIFQGFGGASFATEQSKIWIQENSLGLMSLLTLSLFGLLYYLYNVKKVDILKIQILGGTFALAMAFASNNLVNFIGISLSSLRGYDYFTLHTQLDPNLVSGDFIRSSIKTPTVYLLTAGLIIVLTIWLSSKAKSVTHTEIQLSRQNLGYERFKSSILSNIIVTFFKNVSTRLQGLIPKVGLEFIQSRFEFTKTNTTSLTGASFDPIRASVNLTVATIIISAATLKTLPISTTYVTFMAAMGSSLADGAWNKENATNRITGVLYIFSGWFLTSFIAFATGFLITLVLQQFHVLGLFIVAIVAISITYFFHQKHKQLVEKRKNEELSSEIGLLYSQKHVKDQSYAIFHDTLQQVNAIFQNMITAFAFADRHLLKKIGKDTNQLRQNYEQLRDNIEMVVKYAPQDLNGNGKIYVQTILGIGELSNIIRNISLPSIEYTETVKPILSSAQLNELQTIFESIKLFTGILIKTKKLETLEEIHDKIDQQINENKQAQLNLIKTEGQNVKSGILYLKLLSMFLNFTEKSYEIAAMQIGKSIR